MKDFTIDILELYIFVFALLFGFSKAVVFSLLTVQFISICYKLIDKKYKNEV